MPCSYVDQYTQQFSSRGTSKQQASTDYFSSLKTRQTMTDSEIQEYLLRINHPDCTADIDGLTRVQKNHMEYIPFENLDIVVGKKIRLDHLHLFRKIISNKRGGYCFELNTLYAELLKFIGFSPRPVLGRVWLSNPMRTPPRNHLAHLVDLDGKTYLTDVGFGGLVSRVPLDIHQSASVDDGDGMVRIVPFSSHQFMIQRQTEKGWADQYSFENLLIGEEDITMANYYMSTNSNSHFFYHKFVGRNTKTGRIGLFNNKMSIRKGTKVINKIEVASGEDWLKTIKQEFGLELDFTKKQLDILFEKREKLSQ